MDYASKVEERARENMAKVLFDPNRPPKSIDLDCPPGSPRPGDLIDGVLEGTGLVAGEPVAKFFGNWTWIFPDVSDERWAEIQKITAPRIKALYEKGLIRYGSW